MTGEGVIYYEDIKRRPQTDVCYFKKRKYAEK